MDNKVRFHQMTAPNGQDLNSLLSPGDISIMDRALREFINVKHTRLAMLGMKPSQHDNELRIVKEEYERALVALYKLTGKNPIAN
jgi:hypothetical protein